MTVKYSVILEGITLIFADIGLSSVISKKFTLSHGIKHRYLSKMIEFYGENPPCKRCLVEDLWSDTFELSAHLSQTVKYLKVRILFKFGLLLNVSKHFSWVPVLLRMDVGQQTVAGRGKQLTRFGPNKVAADMEETEDLIFW